MKLYRSMDDLYNVPSVAKGHDINLQAMHVALVNGSVINDTSTLSQQIKTYINEVAPPDKRIYPIRFHLPVTNWAFPTSLESVLFVRNFGRILRIRDDARRLSAVALFNLAKQFKLAIDPRHELKRDSFVGVHLRTEADAGGVFPIYEDQAAYLLEYITSSEVKVAFMATGTEQKHVAAFAARARDFNVTVVAKKDLLLDEDLRTLNELTWDQRALVDYEIMLRAGLMAGPAESAFAWNLALRRAGAAGTPEDAPPTNSSHVAWRDGRSTLFGSSKQDRGLPYQETIWP